MYRPNRIGPFPIADIEIPPWHPGNTLMTAIDAVTTPLIGGGVRSVTVPLITNSEIFHDTGQIMTTGGNTTFALGCLISGLNPDPSNNIIYSIAGSCSLSIDSSDAQGYLFPIIAKLDATPSDPDVLITITDYSILPMESSYTNQGIGFFGQVNTQVIVGNIRGSTASQSNLPIFVGWAFSQSDATAFTIGTILGQIGVYKYLEDLQTQDPTR